MLSAAALAYPGNLSVNFEAQYFFFLGECYLFVSHPKRRVLLSGQVCKFSYQWHLAQVPPFNTCRWHIDWIFYQFSLAAGVGVGKMEWRSPLLFCLKGKRLEKKRPIGKWATKGLFFQYWQSRVLACGSFPCIGFITLCFTTCLPGLTLK